MSQSPERNVVVVERDVLQNQSANQDHKDRLVAQLRQEAMDLRAREREYKNLQDQLLSLEQNFNRVTDEKRRMEEDYKNRVEVNINMISTLRQEIDDQKSFLIDRKKQNADLYTELDQQKEVLNVRHVEISRLKSDLAQHQDLNSQLLQQKKYLEEELMNLRERNRQDAEETDKLNYQNELKSKESADLTAQTRTLEYDISKQLARIDDLNKLIDAKTFDLKNKDAQLVDCEGEIIQLKNQVESFQNELRHLKTLEEKYRNENTDLQKRIDQESGRNIELTTSIKELEAKIRSKEDQIMYMRKELEGARYSNSALLDNNSNLQVEIDSLNNHIRVITHQNEELTKELDQFVQANEAIRQRLDRKARVLEIRQRNDQ